MNITRGRIGGAKKVILYGPEGIGKSTFAAKFPDPVFIDTEGSTKDMDVARFDTPSSWQMLLNEVQYVIDHPDVCRTLVIDTADWAEQLEISSLCAKKGWDGLEGAGYGKGYQYSAEEFGQLLNKLTDITGKGINVVLTAHAQLRKVELPEEMGAYDHWEMKTSKKVAPMIREWADMVLFANYKTRVVEVNKKKKAQGGQRVMYTTHTPFWDAKNRYDLPEELPLDYEGIRHVIENAAPADPRPEPMPEPEIMRPETAEPSPLPPVVEDTGTGTIVGDQMNLPLTKAMEGEQRIREESLDKRIPKKLRDLMIADQIGEWDLENICEAKGYVPAGTKIGDYEKVNEGLIEGGIIAYWDSVVQQIREMRANQEVPFN